MTTLIVTACPSGVANSLLAAKLLTRAAKEQDHNIVLECHSSLDSNSLIDGKQLATVDKVIVVADTSIRNQLELQRFNGKQVYVAEMSELLANPKAFLGDALSKLAPFTASAPAASEMPTTQPSNSGDALNIVGITACPTGVAHTFMAAEALEEGASKQGHQIKIETRGSVGAKNTLSEQEIAAADLVIIAADIEVDMARFDGKRVYKTSTGNALKKTQETLAAATQQASVYQHQGNTSQPSDSKQEKTGVYKHLMTGVSHMLPLVVAGGLCIALSFVFGIEAFQQEGTLAAALMSIGGASAFALMVPVLSGYIAYSIADRPGLAPGLVGGMLASSIGAGFLGGILSGFLAGYLAKWMVDNIKLPSSMEALKPILIVPFLATLVSGLVMIYIIGKPVASVMDGLTTFLNNMGDANAILLGILLGAMMCFDMGGPVNKAAYTFGVGLLGSQTYEPMAAVMAAGMVPALGMGVATFIAKAKFSDSEREAGKASFALGWCFISEGAIPFAAKDPMRVIPACMAGGALTGALSMLIGAELLAPHGGLFVLLIPNAISPVLLYLGAIVAGTLVTGVGYAALKSQQQLAAA
ncbi:PTS fructose transporter subunit IIBC [Aliagarivorans taiwanensis]|uniref:PTS fructose transporter subunit IIBC n=1 Tax=Aliagarivorans taiwanensis TaxID=561966 RepID=UPI0004120B14|nr:PTS fructose transporter subunit IIBC [Aliagarivorans taiwanensis]